MYLTDYLGFHYTAYIGGGLIKKQRSKRWREQVIIRLLNAVCCLLIPPFLILFYHVKVSGATWYPLIIVGYTIIAVGIAAFLLSLSVVIWGQKSFYYKFWLNFKHLR